VVAGGQRDLVSRLMGGTEISDDGNVYAVALEGQFVGYTATRSPRYSGPPEGRHLLLLYEVTTRRLTDWSLTNTAPNLEQIHEPIELELN